MALGVGAVAGVFGVVYATLLRPLPYPEAGRIVLVRMDQGGGEQPGTGRVSLPDYRDWREQSRVFEALSAVADDSFVLTDDDLPQRVSGARVTGEFFSVFRVTPILGGIRPERWGGRGARVVVLANELWQTRFGADPAVVGKALRIDGETYEVVAVMPATLGFPTGAALWLPLDAEDPEAGADQRGARYLLAAGVVRPRVTVDAASRELSRLSKRLAAEHPETDEGYAATLQPLREWQVGDVRQGLIALITAVGLVLLIVCANLAGLLVARGTARSGELWLRSALGASTPRLVRLLVIETLLLSGVGGIAAYGVARTTGRTLAALYPLELTETATSTPGAVVFVFGLATALVAGLLVTVPAAIQADRVTRREPGGKGVVGGGRFSVRTQALLLVAQVAVTLALLVAGGLQLRSLARLIAVDPGFRTDGLLAARVSLPASRYPEDPQRAAFFRDLLDRLAHLGGVRSVAAVTSLPLSGSDMVFGFQSLDGGGQMSGGGDSRAHFRAVSPGYFRTIGVPVLEGRAIEPWDDSGTPPVMVVNEAFVRRFLGGGPVVGRRIRITFGEGAPRRVVGVVGNLRHSSLGAPPEPEMYVPYTQQPWPFMTLVIEPAAGPPSSLATSVRAEVARLDPDQPVDRVATLDEMVAGSLARPRFYGQLLGIFAVLALMTAAVGIYGLTSYWVGLRRRDIGIQMAIGASPARIRALFLARPVGLGLVGTALGIGIALLLAPRLSGLLYEVSPTDLPTVAGMAAVLVATVVVAAWVPARRASRVDPVAVLRNE